MLLLLSLVLFSFVFRLYFYFHIKDGAIILHCCKSEERWFMIFVMVAEIVRKSQTKVSLLKIYVCAKPLRTFCPSVTFFKMNDPFATCTETDLPVRLNVVTFK